MAGSVSNRDDRRWRRGPRRCTGARGRRSTRCPTHPRTRSRTRRSTRDSDSRAAGTSAPCARNPPAHVRRATRSSARCSPEAAGFRRARERGRRLRAFVRALRRGALWSCRSRASPRGPVDRRGRGTRARAAAPRRRCRRCRSAHRVRRRAWRRGARRSTRPDPARAFRRRVRRARVARGRPRRPRRSRDRAAPLLWTACHSRCLERPVASGATARRSSAAREPTRPCRMSSRSCGR